MTRVNVTTQAVPLAGLAPVLTAPTASNDVVDIGNCALLVSNASGASINVTIVVPGLVDGDLVVGPRVVAVAAAAVNKMIPLTSPRYRQTEASVDSGQAADVGRAYVNYSAVASVTRAVVSL
jgi:hypothetical protein